MASKSPFEIRTELLQLSQSICNERVMAQRMSLENDWYLRRELWSIEVTKGLKPNLDLPKYPKMPSVSAEDVISEAKKLNDFVSNG